jgi:para-nitrobenzyl esterase
MKLHSLLHCHCHHVPRSPLVRWTIVIGFISLGLLVTVAARAAEAPVAATTAGKVRGRTLEGGTHVFLGVPYGGDTAERRFQSPVPPKPWAEVREATAFGPAAIWPGGNSSGYSHGTVPQGEDCLNLNLWTPALRDGRKRPVFVYLHGGGFATLSANQIDGTQLSRRGDAVLVGVNHRLNGWGFLHLGDVGGATYATSANAGLQDIVLALQWIRDNIAEFGGDPGCVTIFGESGGAAKCTMLMTMPAAAGLFHRVWTMSGSGLAGMPKERAAQQAQAVLKALDLTPDRVGEIAQLPKEKLIAALNNRQWEPVVDGTVLPRNPFVPDAAPLSARIPLVIGTTHDEMMPFLEKDPHHANLTWESLVTMWQARLRGEPTAETVVAEYRKLFPDYTPRDVAFALATVGIWRDAALQADRRALQEAPTYVYQLDWPGHGRSAHAIDLWLAVNDPTLNWRTTREPDAQQVADLLAEALLAFGRTGNPAHAAIPKWPRYTAAERPTMIFELPARLANDPRAAERKIFERK